MKKIIFDTDIGGDCDDAGALAILHQAANSGLVQLLGITISTGDPWAPACADAINRHYGRILPIGKTQKAPIGDPSMAEFLERYGKHIAENFENEYLPKPAECSLGRCVTYPVGAVLLMRRLLTENEKVTLVVVGSCVNLAALLNSAGDEYSPLTGLELVEKKVTEVVLMGGYFGENSTPEYNIKIDIPSAKLVFEKCPVPVAVSHFAVGLQVFSGGRLVIEEPENPAAEAYRFHVGGKRHSWDPIAAFYAVYGCDGVFTDDRVGKITVSGDGMTLFEACDGLHRLIDCPDISAAEKRLDEAMCSC